MSKVRNDIRARCGNIGSPMKGSQMKRKKATGSIKARLTVQIALTGDIINRLRQLRSALYGYNRGDKTPLNEVVELVLATALAHPNDFCKIVDRLRDRAEYLGVSEDELRGQLLHCPDGHRGIWNAARVKSTPFDSQAPRDN